MGILFSKFGVKQQTLLNGDARFAWEKWARLRVINLSAQPVAAFDGL
jgi:hypothetical protein